MLLRDFDVLCEAGVLGESEYGEKADTRPLGDAIIGDFTAAIIIIFELYDVVEGHRRRPSTSKNGEEAFAPQTRHTLWSTSKVFWDGRRELYLNDNVGCW